MIDTPYKVPQFAAETQEVSVDENIAPGLAVVRIQANDPDGDEPRYSLGGIDATAFNQLFRLNNLSGLIKVKIGATVDYETKSSYSITLNVTDGEDANGNAENPPVIDDSIDVTITVNDLEEEGVVTISEAAPVTGTPIHRQPYRPRRRSKHHHLAMVEVRHREWQLHEHQRGNESQLHPSGR